MLLLRRLQYKKPVIKAYFNSMDCNKFLELEKVFKKKHSCGFHFAKMGYAFFINDLKSIKHENLLYLPLCMPSEYALHSLNCPDLFKPETKNFFFKNK